MIRKYPLKTYLKKGGAQTSFSYPQASLWPPNNYGDSQTSGKSIEELSSDYLESTFDRIAKDARLPTPPLPLSNSSINTSSDVTTKIPSPVNREVHEFRSKQEEPRARANRRAKRKPNHSRLVSDDTEVIVKKRLKHDLINVSTKKSKAVRSSKRKLCPKNGKTLADNKQKQELHPQDSSLVHFELSTAACQDNGKKITKNLKKKVTSYRNRKKKIVRKLSSSSVSGNSTAADSRTEVCKINPKSKTYSASKCNAGSGKLNVSASIGPLPREQSNSLKINVANENDEKNCFVDEEQAPKDSGRALAEIQYSVNTRRVRNISQRMASDDFQSNFNSIHQPGCSKISESNEVNKENLLIKPCSIVLLKYDEKSYPIISEKNSTGLAQYSKACSLEDIFQSSIANVTSIDNTESTNEVKINSHESEKTRQTQLAKNRSGLFHNSDISSMKTCVVKIHDCRTNKIYDRSKKQNTNSSLHYLKCSTPINSYVKIDRSLSHISPISLNNDKQICLKDNKFSIENSIDKNLLMVCDVDFASSSKEYFSIPKRNLRRKSSRKELSISYEGDESFAKSYQYSEQNEVKKTSDENFERQKISDAIHSNYPEQIKSPTSQIQKSLEILKLDLGSPSNNREANVNHKRRLPHRGIFTGSADGNRSVSVSEKTDKYESLNELTSKSKDSYSQLTPVGIITTRSGRQLKLTVTAKKKFFDDSKNPQIQSDISEIANNSDLDSTCEMIENSEKVDNLVTKSTRFSVLKSYNGCDSPDGIERLNYTDMSVVLVDISSHVKPDTGTSEVHVSNDSMYHGSVNLNDKNNLRKNSQNESSECSTKDSQLGSISDNSVSLLSSEQIDTSVSITTDKNTLQSITNCTKNIDSLSIKSHADAKSEYPSSSKNGIDSEDSEWISQSSSGHNDSVLSNKQEITNDSKSDYSIHSLNNNSNEDPNWSTISSCESNDSTITDIDESMKNESKESSKLPDRSSTSSKEWSILNESRSNSKHLGKASNKKSRTASDQSSEWSDVALDQRIRLLSTRINTRRRHRRSLKLDTENMKQVIENKCITQSPKEDRAIENEVNDSDELEDSNSIQQSLDVDLRRNLQPLVLLEKLRDPVKPITSSITNDKQSRHSKLTAIYEKPDKDSKRTTNSSNESLTVNYRRVDEASDEFRRPDVPHSLHKKSLRNDTLFEVNARTTDSHFNYDVEKLNSSKPETIRKQSLFLKPGKEWARSLSILNNIQNGLDLELLSAGKGKNWRNSVQSILSMQQERVVESCLRKNEDNKDSQSYHGTPFTNRTSCLEDQSIGSTSPSRFTRRMSIRVVPDNKNLSHIEDTSFLEAYGISATHRETLVCDVERENVGIESVENEHVATARDVVLQRCSQEYYLPFEKYFPNEYLNKCRKIGEGVYGEVFLYENGRKKSVVKIIPIEGDTFVNGERQKRFHEILSEIVTAKELHNLRYGENYQTDGFVEVKNISCIYGEYPEKLIELWKAYDDDKGSDNDCPSMFDKDQLYIVLELGHGGQDLEAFVFESAVESHAVFVQAAMALAVAEQSLEFEHRDLHWGNILTSHTKKTRVTYKLNDKEYSYPSKGMQVAIIDFTLSRMSYEGCCIFNDLALDPSLFTAEGEYQFEVYRLMRTKIGNNWQKFEPYTNVLWLHYILDKMITALRYKRKTTKVHKDAISQLQELKEVVLDYESAFDLITNCDKITHLQCKSATTAKSTQVKSNELNTRKR